MTFLRFVVAKKHPASGVESGLFDAAYSLCRSDDTTLADRHALRELLAWFEENLATPDRFNRTSSKGHYRRAPKGISWFRDSATEHIRRMHELKRIVEDNGHFVVTVEEDKVGYVVYEDDTQVIAEPFADTRTGS
jgi:hypothetical protein